MKINRNKLLRYLQVNGISLRDFLVKIHWTYSRFINMMYENGELEQKDAMEFIQTVGAKDALQIINWRLMNVRKPKYTDIFRQEDADNSETI